MVVIGKKFSKTRIQFTDADTGKSRGITMQGMDFNKIFDNTKYFLEQLVTYPEIKLICYGGTDNGKKTINRRREGFDNEKSEQTQENYGSVETSREDN